MGLVVAPARVCEIRGVAGLSRRQWVRGAAAGVVLAGCRGRGETRGPAVPVLTEARLFAAPGGARLNEAEVVRAMAGSDVVLIGEQHGHPLGLALAASLFEQLLASAEGKNAALALEFLGRELQAKLDAYLRGEVDEAGFRAAAELTKESSYPAGHRRMVAAAKAKQRPVIAANATRALVKRARLEGLAGLRTLPAGQREHVEVPEALTEGKYREDFMGLMGGHSEVDAATLEGFYRAQNVWDATMAASVVRALGTARPVVLVVGSFHVDDAGGLYQRVRAAAPEAKVWRLSVVSEAPEALRPEDRGRADVVAYVGAAGI